MATPIVKLTDDEATFLALLLRVQPATAYQLSKIYADSPVSNFGVSKGKVYPLVRRLEVRGLVRAIPIAGDGRGSEALECTRRGKEAVRRWVKQIRPGQLLLEDPLRTMVQTFDLLSREEQLAWIDQVRDGLSTKLRELEAYATEVSVPYQDVVHDNAVSSVQCRLDWLKRLRRRIIKSKAHRRP